MSTQQHDIGTALLLAEMLAQQRAVPTRVTAVDLLGGLFLAFEEEISAYFDRPDEFAMFVTAECGLEASANYGWQERMVFSKARPVAEYIPGTTCFVTRFRDEKGRVGHEDDASLVLSKVNDRLRSGHDVPPRYILALLADDPNLGPKLVRASLSSQRLRAAK